MKLEYKIGNRTVTKSQHDRHMKDSIEDLAKRGVIDAVQSTRCAKHGKYAKVDRTTKTGSGFSFEISGCCDELVARAQSAIGS